MKRVSRRVGITVLVGLIVIVGLLIVGLWAMDQQTPEIDELQKQVESLKKELAFEGFGQLSRLQRNDITEALVAAVVLQARRLEISDIEGIPRSGSRDARIEIDHNSGRLTVSIPACEPLIICPEDFQEPFSMTFVR